ncbi:MAG: FtsX-like permease family protein [Verrucomicrobiota bacterium]|nr:FtsX-like permease family protein [Verrucomicrobiota bacterium]
MQSKPPTKSSPLINRAMAAPTSLTNNPAPEPLQALVHGALPTPWRLTLHIAWRFLIAKRRAMLMSLAGIVFGVAFFIVTQAQTSGFEGLFIRTIWGTNGAIRVQDEFQNTVASLSASNDGGSGFQIPLRSGRTYIPGVQYPAEVTRAVKRFSSVAGVSEVLRGRINVSGGFRTETSEVLGIRLSDHLSVSTLASQIRYGNLENYANDPGGIIIGIMMAQRMQADIGDSLLLQSSSQTRRYRVAAIFETGVEEFDKRRVYIHLRDARMLLNEPQTASFLQVSLYDNNQADQVSAQMEEALHHNVNSWQKSEKTWLEVFRALRFSAAITMGVIILIAGLGMFNTLAIIVMERRREIAILRSMGYTRRDVEFIFLNQGLIVLVVGTVLAWGMAFLLTLGVANLPIRIRGILSTDHFVVSWSIWHYVIATAIATVVVLVAAYIPARRAAQIEPGEIIRGTSG